MNVLEPVPKAEIPEKKEGRPYNPERESILQRALELDGLALPVQFETSREAMLFRYATSGPGSRTERLGLRTALRGKTVFVFRAEELS